jgi:ribonuclease HI
MNCIAYVDGGRVPRSKLTTIGGIIFNDGMEVAKYSEIGGEGSNTDAEWQSLIRCMRVAVEHGASTLHVKTDFRPIADMLRTEYEILKSMALELDRNPNNRGLKKALHTRSRQKFGSVKALTEWIEENKSDLQAKDSFIRKYRQDIIDAMAQLNLTVQLIPREENAVADALCREARATAMNSSHGVPPNKANSADAKSRAAD